MNWECTSFIVKNDDLHFAETMDHEDRECFKVVLAQKFQPYSYIVNTPCRCNGGKCN